MCFHRLRGAAWQNFVIHSEFIVKLQTIFHILIKGKNALVQFLNVSKATHSRCYLMAFFSLHWNWVLWAGTTIGVLEFFIWFLDKTFAVLFCSFLCPQAIGYHWCLAFKVWMLKSLKLTIELNWINLINWIIGNELDGPTNIS